MQTADTTSIVKKVKGDPQNKKNIYIKIKKRFFILKMSMLKVKVLKPANHM